MTAELPPDEALERRCASLFPARSGKKAGTFKGKHSTDTVQLAAELVDESGIVELLNVWRREDDPGHGTRGGRPAIFSDRHVLILQMLHAITDDPLLFTELANTVHRRLDPKSYEILALPPMPDADYGSIYTNLRRAAGRFLDVIDSAPFNSGKRLTYSQVQEIRRRRAEITDHLAKKHQRASWVTNQLLHMTHRLLPTEIRANWKGTICVDGTAMPVWGARGSPRKADLRPDSICSPEFDAGWHVRSAEDHKDDKRFKRKRDKFVWAYEATIAVMADDPDTTGQFPKLALAVSLEKPAGQVSENAMICVNEIVNRGLPVNYFVGDRAYLPNAKIEKLQEPLKALGYKLVADYNRDQLGIQDQHAGAIMVEGVWYCKAMPEAQVNASIDYRDGKISKQVHYERIDARRPYQLQVKSNADHNGVVQVRCPCAGPSPTVNCSLKPPKNGKPNLGIPTILKPPEHPDRICTNRESVAFGPKTGLKYGQAVPYHSKEWHQLYGTPRNTVESGNNRIKDEAKAALKLPGRRRGRGYTLQMLYAAFLIAGTNIQLINSFRAKTTTTRTTEKIVVRTDRRRRKTTPDSYRQRANAPPLVGPAAEAAAN
ncbi:conserved hypothetical protein [Segniliparus rotundus DSM 44985]|uniref:Uncharacterized protein n=1 Tax=Segniliparus rotundus (strain ATCC BAA-972 / CDC 1076 / CIP 108378 / DSM 44985 / JCM 13578) TaxID=640132 RepID=D6Z8C0_SEGRD|nr:hypothetical protein [Segniliparus rotundus]ADG98200.1 conserved hypothetical protein [Segniliparus rotundus DSM 44985]